MEYEGGKAGISEETFDQFLASLNLLDDCEQEALKEIAANQEQNR
jgi:hypothetical protein